MYIPAIVMVSFYFEERRALATGDTLLTDNYSMILMSLHLLVCKRYEPTIMFSRNVFYAICTILHL